MDAKSFLKNNWPLITLYLAVVGLCVYLNWGKTKENKAGLFISIVMLAIVLVIFVIVLIKSFLKMDEMTATLDAAKNRIINDQKEDNYLWSSYHGEQKVYLISSGPLLKEYRRFEDELNRLENSKSGYRCTIEDYINEDVIDQKVNKGLIGMIPGAMTGMGILGTFVGLAIGLQGFNFGSSDDMIKSIPLLMGGLKVAFHTSIYGMVFSLVFNLISKAKLGKTYNALDAFLIEFSKSVLPDAANENQSRMLKEQQEQNEKIIKNLRNMAEGQKELNDNLGGYSKKVYEAQSQAMKKLAKDFVGEMSQSLSGDFAQMHEIIERTGEMQAQNSEVTLQVVSEVSSMTKQLKDVNRSSVESVKRMQSYIQNMNTMQNGMNEFMENVNAQLEEVRNQSQLMHEYIQQITENESRLVETVGKNTEATSELLSSVLEMQSTMMENAQLQYSELASSAKAQNEILSKNAEAQMERMAAYAEEQARILSNIARTGRVREGFFTRLFNRIFYR